MTSSAYFVTKVICKQVAIVKQAEYVDLKIANKNSLISEDGALQHSTGGDARKRAHGFANADTLLSTVSTVKID